MTKEIDIKNLREILESLDPETTNPKELNELQLLLESYESLSKEYKILDVTLSEKQQMMEDAIYDRWMGESLKKYFLYWGGNDGGKTFGGAYICGKLALGSDVCEKLGLKAIGTKKDIIIGSEDSGVLKNIRNYLIGDDSSTRIPPEYIESIKEPGDFIKEIKLTTGSRIRFITYKSGQESWQGHNPDFIWLDEEPKNHDVFNEAYARSRKPNCIMMMTMTPTGHSQLVSDMFIDNENKDWMEKFVWVQQVFGYLDNPFSASDHVGGMSKEEIKRRVEGSFQPPEGLVYKEFRKEHIIPHIDPFRSKDIGYDTDYYIGVDPGANHGFGIVFLCRTSSYNPSIPDTWYLYDELLFEGKPLSYIIDELHKKKSMMGKQPKHIIIDSQARQVGIDMKHAGIKCIPADKRSVGKNRESNRTSGINLINDLFFQGRFFISEKCVHSIKQFRKHFYKPGETDGAVVKLDDDLLDAIRYPISFVELFEKKKKYNKKARGSYGIEYDVGY